MLELDLAKRAAILEWRPDAQVDALFSQSPCAIHIPTLPLRDPVRKGSVGPHRDRLAAYETVSPAIALAGEAERTPPQPQAQAARQAEEGVVHTPQLSPVLVAGLFFCRNRCVAGVKGLRAWPTSSPVGCT